MKKYVFFAFNGNPLCFIHVLLNVLDMDSKGIEARIVFEGEAVKLPKIMVESNNPLYKKVKEKGLVDSICKACSAKMEVLEYNATTGIPLSDDMNGHPSMAGYLSRGYEIITL